MKLGVSKLRIVKRVNVPLSHKILAYAIAVLAAMAVGAVLLIAMGVNPLLYYKDVLTIGLTKSARPATLMENFIIRFTPLLMTTVALCLAFRMRFWNIGGEGQFIVGSLAASAVALTLGDKVPDVPLLIIMVIASMLSAGAFGCIAAICKVKFGTNETLFTLMLNYIALYALYFFGETSGKWNFFLNPASARPSWMVFSNKIADPVITIGNFHLQFSFIIAVLICVIVYFYLRKTKQGYEISVVGDSASTAKYAGMKVGKIIIRTVFLSAALIGLAGMFKAMSGGTMSSNITNDVGWTGIIVAWLAKLNVVGSAVVSLLICVLEFGCVTAASSYRAIDSNFADLLQGLVLFAALVADFAIRFKITHTSKTQTPDKQDKKEGGIDE